MSQLRRVTLIDELIRRGVSEARDGRILQKLKTEELETEYQHHLDWEGMERV